MTAATVPFLRRRLAPYIDGMPRIFWVLFAGSLVNRVGSFILPMLMVYLTVHRKVDVALAGSIVALHGLGSLLGTALGGLLADRVGRRATILLSLTTSPIAMLSLGWAKDPLTLAAGVFSLGLAADMFRPAVLALVADIIPPHLRMRAFSLQYWAINLGFAIAAAVGGLLAATNFSALFIGDAVTTLAFAAIVYIWIPETRPEVPAGHVAQGSFWTPFVDAKFALFLLLNLAVVMIFVQHATVLPLDMRANGLNEANYGLAIATNGVLIVLLQPALTRWAEGKDPARLLAVAAALTGLGFALTLPASTQVAYMGTVAVWTLGEIIMAPTNMHIVAELSPAHLRGRYQGAFGLSWSVAFMLGPLLGPLVARDFGRATLWLGCGAVGLVVAGLHLTVGRKVLHRETT